MKMPEYEVTLSGTAQLTIKIEAENEDEAADIAESADVKWLFSNASEVSFDIDEINSDGADEEDSDEEDPEFWDDDDDFIGDQDPIGDDTPDRDDLNPYGV